MFQECGPKEKNAVGLRKIKKNSTQCCWYYPLPIKTHLETSKFEIVQILIVQAIANLHLFDSPLL